MNTIDIRQKLHHYIETAQEKKVKAIDHWNNESFVAELQRRETSYLNGTTKTYTLEQSLSRASQAVKKVKNK